MTYYESYVACGSIERAREKAVQDIKMVIFLGSNPDRYKAIEGALNRAITDMRSEQDG